jgi:hypothetical protein
MGLFVGQPKKGPYLRIRGFAICACKKNTEEHAPTQKTPIQNKMFATVRSCICVFVSELTKSQPKGKIAKMSSPGSLVNNNITPLKMTLIISHRPKSLLFYHTYGF